LIVTSPGTSAPHVIIILQFLLPRQIMHELFIWTGTTLDSTKLIGRQHIKPCQVPNTSLKFSYVCVLVQTVADLLGINL